jgi:nitric oxide reductase subunit B
MAVVILGSFAVLGWFGREIYQQAPPIPSRVVTTDGTTLFTQQQIEDGQNVWQSTGGQEIGTVWGHGAYVAPDWTADFVHREATYILDKLAVAHSGKPYADLDMPTQDMLKAQLREEVRTNTFNPATGVITVSPMRAEAIRAVGEHYADLWGTAPDLQKLRDADALPPGIIKTPERMAAMNAFFFWASWACSTNRPGQAITYTNNWPGEPLIGNGPTPAILVWSVVSVVFLLAGIGVLTWYYAALRRRETGAETDVPATDPLTGLKATPSMKATLWYFWVVAALILVQIGLGVVTAHYGVEGNSFYGFPLSKFLPYAVTRSWHLQLGIFWIATAWLATGLFVAPAVSGYEPKFQKAGVVFLLVALVAIVVGSMAGEWLGVMQKLGYTANFWFGHQGYEYIDLGKFWQAFLLVGLFIWLALVTRALAPAFKKNPEDRSLLGLFLISSLAIAGFYGAALMIGKHTNLAIAEYWRWWVVHLWVEGFFEVFATVVIAFLFTRMGLLRTLTATSAVLFSTIVYLAGGIIGTFHHLYFTGTPTAVLALGASFSALEVVPLALIGIEGYENLTMSRVRPWVANYKWPIYFFVAVAFWNLVGAGLFGFLINPPIALYYMQGLNTTPVHGHTALFGVYGMLGIGLMLFCLRGLTSTRPWKTGVLSFAFWAINIGLALMVLLSLLPVGLLQTWASVEHGMWYARSAEFLQTPLMAHLRWMRVFGDVTFSLGAVALGWFVAGLKTGWSLEPENTERDRELAVR